MVIEAGNVRLESLRGNTQSRLRRSTGLYGLPDFSAAIYDCQASTRAGLRLCHQYPLTGVNFGKLGGGNACSLTTLQGIARPDWRSASGSL
jgi:hypothetical protein